VTTRDLTASDITEPTARTGRSIERWLVFAIFAMVVALALAFALPRLSQAFAPAALERMPGAGSTLAGVGRIDGISIDDKAQIVVEGSDAQSGNAAIPFIDQPLGAVQAFGLAAARNETYATALKCLTQAVYYEAAVEPMQGRRAVAQVVLNRMRHPAYPKSVCGVVYQGAERRTGCQFSFTCDGSLLRQPATGPWAQAHAVAQAALAGYVEPSVGTATFYHADYVLPKWAYQLGKITQIGRHLFYRFHGSWGAPATFSGRYAGTERIPALDLMALRERVQDEQGLALAEGPIESFTPGLTVAPHVTDRHAENDVGGRIDMTKEWRPSIPDPVAASSRYREVLATTVGASAGSEAAAAPATAASGLTVASTAP
jgi:spore germination cell wall hydrolase CwlJ-like protein